MVVFSECSRPIVSNVKQSEFVGKICKLLSNQVSLFSDVYVISVLGGRTLCFSVVFNGKI